MSCLRILSLILVRSVSVSISNSLTDSYVLSKTERSPTLLLVCGPEVKSFGSTPLLRLVDKILSVTQFKEKLFSRWLCFKPLHRGASIIMGVNSLSNTSDILIQLSNTHIPLLTSSGFHFIYF